MCKQKTVLISIHPEHMDSVFSGKKNFEYRKRFSQDVQKLVFYATAPISKIVGYATVEEMITGSPVAVWRKTKASSGISYAFFQTYFEGKDLAIAIKIGRPSEFIEPLDLASVKIKSAPQSYQFLDSSQEQIINGCVVAENDSDVRATMYA